MTKNIFKKEARYFLSECRRHYSIRFLIGLFLFVLLLIVPILFVKSKVIFDSKEFANIYFSTVFGALLIGLILQFTDLYRSSTAAYNNAVNLIIAIKGSTNAIISKLDAGERNLQIYSKLLSHYKRLIENSFTFDNSINEHIIAICTNEDLEYIIQSLHSTDHLSDSKAEQVRQHSNNLMNYITLKLCAL